MEVGVAQDSSWSMVAALSTGHLSPTRERRIWQISRERGMLGSNRRSRMRAGESAVRRNRAVECGDVRKGDSQSGARVCQPSTRETVENGVGKNESGNSPAIYAYRA